MNDEDRNSEELDLKEDQHRTNSLESNMLTPKQYFLVNLSKFLVEMVGTAILGIFYMLMGDEQTGMLLGFWVITLFAESISGSHFNPAITLVFMLRKNSSLGQRRLKGIIYIAAQMCGGIITGLFGILVNEDVVLYPRPVLGYYPDDHLPKEQAGQIYYSFKTFGAFVSETIGAFIFIFLFMLSTDKKTQFSNDKVINCFILAASYVAARLMCGGELITVFTKIKLSEFDIAGQVEAGLDNDNNSGSELINLAYSSVRQLNDVTTPDGTNPAPVVPKVLDHEKHLQVMTAGPLLNPAIAFGLMTMEGFNFSLDTIQYLLCPFAGSIMALIFYEKIYVKTQEFLEEDGSENSGADEIPNGINDFEGDIEPGQTVGGTGINDAKSD